MGKIADVQEVTLTKLVPYENNAKKHPQDQIDLLIRSINEYGFINPCLIDKDFKVIAGHGRIEAAKQMGMDKVPCLFVEGLTEAQYKAYVLADNRLSELGEWDMNLVGMELGELEALDFDIDIIGFDNLDYGSDEFGTDFTLPDGDKPDICQMTYTLSAQQKELIESALDEVKKDIGEYFGNTNKNGNALYEVVRQWEEQKK